uniref:Putative secreted protein n=1 Tax=Anopheles marajoara TaxID=58244 RepID=A0A2M4CC70_9DIPT
MLSLWYGVLFLGLLGLFDHLRHSGPVTLVPYYLRTAWNISLALYRLCLRSIFAFRFVPVQQEKRNENDQQSGRNSEQQE